MEEKKRRCDPNSAFPELRKNFLSGKYKWAESESEQKLFAAHCAACDECRDEVVKHQYSNEVRATIQQMATTMRISTAQVFKLMGVY